jgi:hypothetical protein
MEKKKLLLSGIKVQSFVTALSDGDKKTVVAGANTDNPFCRTQVAACVTLAAVPVCVPSISCGSPMSDCPPPLDTNLQCI